VVAGAIEITVSVTGTSLWFSGESTPGDAVTFAIAGGVVSLTYTVNVTVVDCRFRGSVALHDTVVVLTR
jgi:hypothetical protein